MSRRAITFIFVLVGSVAAVPAAHADHDTATATIQATVGPRVKDGIRRYTVTITTACSDPEAKVNWVISRKLTPKNRKAKPAFVGHVQRSRAEPGTTTIKLYVAPGTRWVPAIQATCLSSSDEQHDAEVLRAPRALRPAAHRRLALRLQRAVRDPQRRPQVPGRHAVRPRARRHLRLVPHAAA